MWQNHKDKRIGTTVMKKILWSALVHVKETSGLSVFEPEVHDDMKWRMVAALYEDENLTKRPFRNNNRKYRFAD